MDTLNRPKSERFDRNFFEVSFLPHAVASNCDWMSDDCLSKFFFLRTAKAAAAAVSDLLRESVPQGLPRAGPAELMSARRAAAGQASEPRQVLYVQHVRLVAEHTRDHDARQC